MKRRSQLFAAAAGLMLAASALNGCTACPGVKAEPGRPAAVVRQEPRAAVVATGPYGIELTPAMDVNPVRTQHVLIATVRDQSGNPISGSKVEWILARGPRAVGDIIDVEGGRKIDNTYAGSVTGSGTRVLDMGTQDTADDVQVGPGQTWCVISSALEGTSNVIAYAPEIPNWGAHKAFAEKNWMDVTWQWPGDATNRVGTPHTFTVRVLRYSDSTPYAGYVVNYKLLSGPAGTLSGGGQMGTVSTGADGVATVVLEQSAPMVGTNEVEISIVRPAKKDDCECYPEKLIATGVVRKHWIAADIGITKTAPATAVVGEQFSYDITVTNPKTDLEVRDVNVTDALPEGVEYVSSSPAATVSGKNLSWNLGTLGPSGTSHILVTVKGLKTGDWRNCAVVAAESNSLKRDACANTVIKAAAIKIEKYAPADVLSCDPIPYRIVVRNPGDAIARDVRVVDQLPEGLRTAAGESRVEFPAFELGAGESREFTFDARATGSGTYTNTASVTSGSLTDQASATTKVRTCTLTLVKKADRRDHKFGRPTVFTLTVGNTGDADAQNVVLEDQVPSGMEFVSATDGGAVSGSTLTWNLGTIAAGGSRTVSVTMTANTGGSFTNTATVRGTCCKDTSASELVEYTGISAILLEVVDSPDPIEIGGQTTYTITVTNQGTADDAKIVVAATLAPQQKLISVDTSGAQGVSNSVSGQKVTFAAAQILRPGEKLIYKLVVEAVGVGDVRFAVELNSDQLKTPVNETESTNQY